MRTGARAQHESLLRGGKRTLPVYRNRDGPKARLRAGNRYRRSVGNSGHLEDHFFERRRSCSIFRSRFWLSFLLSRLSYFWPRPSSFQRFKIASVYFQLRLLFVTANSIASEIHSLE